MCYMTNMVIILLKLYLNRKSLLYSFFDLVPFKLSVTIYEMSSHYSIVFVS